MISVVIISKDEPFLAATLDALSGQQTALAARPREVETVVVDASSGRLADIQRAHPQVRWIDFAPPPGVTTSIPHQRNVGVQAARGDVIVFTDAGCVPLPGWLDALTRLIGPGGEHVVVGETRSMRQGFRLYSSAPQILDTPAYLRECPTINLAFTREVFNAVGGFDESFRYGSDVDFSWRVAAAGYRLRRAPEAIVEVDWGDWRRQLRRSFVYGRARVRLYRKHPDRLNGILRNDPVVVMWPIFILGLPIAIWHPAYLLLLAIPLWRNRHYGPLRVLVDHLAFGWGALTELTRA